MNPENKYSICINNKNEDCKKTENAQKDHVSGIRHNRKNNNVNWMSDLILFRQAEGN